MTIAAARTARGIRRVSALAAVSIMAALSLAAPDGFSAAAGEKAAVKSEDATPIILAGRWSGPRHGYSLRKSADQKAADQACGGTSCELTYDIVACPEGWCGIVVTNETPCGAIGVRMKPDTTHNRRNAFTGKLELAKGSAPYTIEAWYRAADAPADGRDPAHLHIVGDTGDGGMLMMRRSFPFQAELTRISDAKCTLEQATI